jgi:hypothetical protein
MARPSSRNRGAKSAPEPRAKAVSKKDPVLESEEGDEKPGMGVDEAVVIMTTIALVAGLLFVDAWLGFYGKGIFFKS